MPAKAETSELLLAVRTSPKAGSSAAETTGTLLTATSPGTTATSSSPGTPQQRLEPQQKKGRQQQQRQQERHGQHICREAAEARTSKGCQKQL
jgi:hypothetical protein